jgi:hypothetical protein
MNFPDGLKNKKIIISRLGLLYSRAGALIDSLFKVLNWHCFRVLLENYKNSFFHNTLLKILWKNGKGIMPLTVVKSQIKRG